MLKKYKKGLLIGGIVGLIFSFVARQIASMRPYTMPAPVVGLVDNLSTDFCEIFFGYPLRGTLEMSCTILFQAIFYGIIGLVIGFLISRYATKENFMKIKTPWKRLKTWQKGAILGGIFGLLQIILFFLGDSISFSFYFLGNEQLPEFLILPLKPLLYFLNFILCDMWGVDAGESCGWVFFGLSPFILAFIILVFSSIGSGIAISIKFLRRKIKSKK